MKKHIKWETHLHTREASACASGSGAEMVRAHREAGYAGMFVTDHFFNGNSAVEEDASWSERVDGLFLGYEHAVREAAGTGFLVLPGFEYTWNGMDFLTYGIGKDFLLAHPDMTDWEPEVFFREVHAAGGFISHAHPFREAFYIPEVQLFPEWVDAVEIRNASHVNPDWDKRALAFAEAHGLPQTAGSDTHHVDRLFGGGMCFEQDIRSVAEFAAAVRERAWTHP